MLGRSHRIREAHIRRHQRGADAMSERQINAIVDRSIERERKANRIRTDALVIGPAERHFRNGSSQRPGLASPNLAQPGLAPQSIGNLRYY